MRYQQPDRFVIKDLRSNMHKKGRFVKAFLDLLRKPNNCLDLALMAKPLKGTALQEFGVKHTPGRN